MMLPFVAGFIDRAAACKEEAAMISGHSSYSNDARELKDRDVICVFEKQKAEQLQIKRKV